MTSITFPTLLRASPRLKAIGRFFSNIVEGLRDAREIESRYDALSRMSDEALACRGISREDIPRVAVIGRMSS